MANKVSFVTSVVQFLAVMLLCAYFGYQAYEIFFNKEKWASSLYSAYGNFEEWWNKSFKRLVWKEFAYTMPNQRDFYPYKQKATLILGYMYGFGSLLLLTGEKWAALILLVPHCLHALLTNAPSSATTYNGFNLMQQSWINDLLIACALIMVTGLDLQISSSSSKSATVASTTGTKSRDYRKGKN